MEDGISIVDKEKTSYHQQTINLLTKVPKVRNASFDIMKGIAMLAVIIGHITTQCHGFIYSFHMPLFFIVSGYFFRSGNQREFMKKDVKHLLYPYLLTCAAILMVYTLRSIFVQKDCISSWILAAFYGSATLSHVSYYCAKIPRIGAIWFLLALFWCKNLFLLIVKHTRYPFLISLLVSVVSALINRYIINAPFTILIGFSATIFYYLGYWVRKQGGFDRLNILLAVGCIMVWLFAMLTSDMSIANALYKNYPVNVIGALGGTYGMYLVSTLLSTTKWIVSRSFEWFGRNSLTILCLHLFEMDVPFFRTFFHVSGSWTMVFAIMFCVVGVLVLKRIPFARRIYNIS